MRNNLNKYLYNLTNTLLLIVSVILTKLYLVIVELLQ